MGEAKIKNEAYQATALEADRLIYGVLTSLGGDSRNELGAVVAGAVMALVRFLLAAAPPPPTVRGVLSVLLPAVNRSAEQLVDQIRTQEAMRAEIEARLNLEANEDVPPTIQ